jgi:hypothetical protein
MLQVIKVFSFAAVLVLMGGADNIGFSASTPVKASDYPALAGKELGHVQYILKLAQQPPGDWSYMGGLEEGQEGIDGYRYQLGYMAYAVALAQYHKTPAYRELYQKAMDSLIQKMVRKDVWYYWEHTSKGGKTTNPALKDKGLGWIDPVVEKNIMYSGHLINMVELYQMLYRDTKYDRPKSITFKWEWISEMLNRYEYDGNKLAEVIHKQFINNPLHMIECELNLVFPVCNQHPLLGLILYDHNHGTNLSSAVKDLMMATFNGKGLLNPTTRDFAEFHMIEQGTTIHSGSAGNDASVSLPMHAWNPKLIEELYPVHARKVEWTDPVTARVPADRSVGISATPAFAGYAKEIGDIKTAKGLMAWTEKNGSPRWTDGRYYYPRNDDMKINNLFSIMAAIADLNVKNGIWSIYNRPWKEDYFSQPFISGVEYPKVIVKQAFYDAGKDVLIVTLSPGQNGVKSASFAVNQLNNAKTYLITKNGKLMCRVKNGALVSGNKAKEFEFKAPGILNISTDLLKEQTFLVQAEI